MTTHDEVPSEPQGEGPDAPVSTESTPTHDRGASTPVITRASAAWVATGVAPLLLVLLVVFILQNQTRVNVKFLGFEGSVALGVALLIAAVGGGILVAVAGVERVMQLRRYVRKGKRDRRREHGTPSV